MHKLSFQKCLPCDKDTPRLKKEEIADFLSQLNEWELLEEGKIEKRLKFKNFKEAISFVNKIAVVAEVENHHPDILIYRWNKLKITLYTHIIDGLSTNDFIMASKIDQIPKV